jgi:hypothetical protein
MAGMRRSIAACSCFAYLIAISVSGHAQEHVNSDEFPVWSGCVQKSQLIYNRCLRTATDIHTLAQLDIRSRKTVRQRYSPACDEARRVWLRRCAGEAVYCEVLREEC